MASCGSTFSFVINKSRCWWELAYNDVDCEVCWEWEDYITRYESKEVSITVNVVENAEPRRLPDWDPPTDAVAFNIQKSLTTWIGQPLFDIVIKASPSPLFNVNGTYTWESINTATGSCGEDKEIDTYLNWSAAGTADAKLSVFNLVGGSVQGSLRLQQGTSTHHECTQGSNCEYTKLEVFQRKFTFAVANGSIEKWYNGLFYSNVNFPQTSVWLSESRDICSYHEVYF